MEKQTKKQTELVLTLMEIKNAGLANDEIPRQLAETTKNLKSNEQKLPRLIDDAAHQRKRKKWKT